MHVIIGMFLLLAAGVVISAVGALAGLGGGFLAVPFLMLLWGLDSEMAVLVSLTMILANAVSSSVTYLRLRLVDIRVFALLVLPTIPGLFLGWWLLRNLEESQFRLLFAVLMAVVMIYILIRNRREEKDAGGERGEGRRRIDPLISAISVPIAFIAGAASSAFGIGGGAILMPLQVGLLKMSVKRAIATSMMLLAVMSGTRVIIISGASFDPFIALPFALGGLLGAQAAAYIVRRAKSRSLLYFLAACMFTIAIYMGTQALLDLW
ncbi:MAG: sulfite exporter TauE/SafE family protein [Candidatus Thermoplasmatota archaeon]|nr:sulfite exporter TauE/SafE family protein [Candidatus Thermoplasmatota archaeon]